MARKCQSNCNLNEQMCTYFFGSDHLKAKRVEQLRCKSRRINVLAQPKYLTRRVTLEPPKPKKVQILRESNLPTRIRMLSLPKVRKLVASLDEYRDFIGSNRIRNYDELIQQSISTMYSRLGNVHLKKGSKPKKWTKDDWQRNCQWLQQRARPKTCPPAPKPKPGKVLPLRKLKDSIFLLSQPRHRTSKYCPKYGYQPVINDSVKFFVPSERLLKLAVPKRDFTGDYEEDDGYFHPWGVNPKALKFAITERLKVLATPKAASPAAVIPEEIERTEYGVIKRALNAATTTRTVDLAKPKEVEEAEQKPRPLVSKNALKAKPTPRILELAIPRYYPK